LPFYDLTLNPKLYAARAPYRLSESFETFHIIHLIT
jgi:hypothetical protein